MTLLEAVKRGDATAVQRIVANGASLEVKGPDGRTSLMCAAEYGRADIVQILVAAGADLEAKDNKGMTAIMIAAEWGWPAEIIHSLIAAGADVNAKDIEGRSALACALESLHIREDSHIEIAQVIAAKMLQNSLASFLLERLNEYERDLLSERNSMILNINNAINSLNPIISPSLSSKERNSIKSFLEAAESFEKETERLQGIVKQLREDVHRDAVSVTTHVYRLCRDLRSIKFVAMGLRMKSADPGFDLQL